MSFELYLEGHETDRLMIRKLELLDCESWEPFFVKNPNLEFLGLDLSLDPEKQSKDWVERQLIRYKENRYGHQALIDKTTGSFIGQCGLLTQEVEGITEIEIGYHILPQYWGHGFATEAARYFKEFAIKHKVSPSVISIIDIRNTLSQKVAEKLGMEVDKQAQMFDLDVYIYRKHM